MSLRAQNRIPGNVVLLCLKLDQKFFRCRGTLNLMSLQCIHTMSLIFYTKSYFARIQAIYPIKNRSRTLQFISCAPPDAVCKNRAKAF